jgi:hypothetical protein
MWNAAEAQLRLSRTLRVLRDWGMKLEEQQTTKRGKHEKSRKKRL